MYMGFSRIHVKFLSKSFGINFKLFFLLYFISSQFTLRAGLLNIKLIRKSTEIIKVNKSSYGKFLILISC